MNTALLFFKREFSGSLFLKGNTSRKIFSVLSSLFIAAFFITLECFLCWQLFDHLSIYANVNWSIYSICLFAFLLLTFFTQLSLLAKRLYGSDKERYIIRMAPVHPLQVFSAKALYAYCFGILVQVLTSLPVALTYGIFSSLSASYYLWNIVAVIFIPLISLGLTLFLLPFYIEIRKRLKKHQFLIFLIGLAIMYVLAWLYSLVLDLFVELLKGGALDTIFTVENMQIMRSLARSFYPTSAFSLAAVNQNLIWNIPAIFTFPIGFLTLGGPISYLYYEKSLQRNWEGERKEKPLKKFRKTAPFLAFFQKELALTFKEEGTMASYLVFVILQPFLVYLVVSTLNAIFSTGNLTYIRSLFPNIYSSIDAITILLFLSIINSTSASSLIKERKTLPLLKVLPYSPAKQMFIKMLVPFVTSALSYLATALLLSIQGEVSWTNFPYVLFMGWFLVAILLFSNLYVDLKGKGSSGFLPIFIDFLFPIVFVVIASLFTLLPGASSQLDTTFYLSLLAMEAFLLLTLIIAFPRRINNLFHHYEGGEEYDAA